MHPVHQFARSRPRLTIAAATGFFVALFLPVEWKPVTRILAGWNVAVWSYLIAVGWLMLHATHARVRQIAEQEERSAGVVLVILSVAAVSSLAAIIVELAQSNKGMAADIRLFHYAFTGLTVLGSWFLVGTIFTFHYAYMFYSAPEHARPLHFPDEEKNPDYSDFLYFAFTISVAAQTADVSLMSRPMRQVVLAQAILSFFFNAAILGFSINIAAGLVGSS
jgi:uncharacterized membrane protein